MSAPADFARCEGARRINGAIVGLCLCCLRRTPGHGERQVWLMPPIQRQRGGVWTCSEFRPTQQ